MRRMVSIVLASVMLLGILSGCGKRTPDGDDSNGSDSQDNVMVVPEKGTNSIIGGDAPTQSGVITSNDREIGDGASDAQPAGDSSVIPDEDAGDDDAMLAGESGDDTGDDVDIPDGTESDGSGEDADGDIDADGDDPVESDDAGETVDVEDPTGAGVISTQDPELPLNVEDTYALPVEAYNSIQDEMVALSAGGFTYNTGAAQLGSVQASNQYGFIDYSYTSDGYVVVKFTASTNRKLKAIVKGPNTSYTYNITAGQQTTLPLSDGNGNYTVTLYQNAYGTKYAAVLSQSFSVSLTDEFAPFLHSNQYVNYENAVNTLATAADLCGRSDELLGKVANVYGWVVGNISYDYNKARTVQSGYLPVLDTVLANRTGICFDYAALMAGMLRSQGIPCKLVVGYAGTAYHAWISVWSSADGWIEGVIYFDGVNWQRMDPTFASSGGSSAQVMQYIGNGANYAAKYLY